MSFFLSFLLIFLSCSLLHFIFLLSSSLSLFSRSLSLPLFLFLSLYPSLYLPLTLCISSEAWSTPGTNLLNILPCTQCHIHRGKTRLLSFPFNAIFCLSHSSRFSSTCPFELRTLLSPSSTWSLSLYYVSLNTCAVSLCLNRLMFFNPED